MLYAGILGPTELCGAVTHTFVLCFPKRNNPHVRTNRVCVFKAARRHQSEKNSHSLCLQQHFFIDQHTCPPTETLRIHCCCYTTDEGCKTEQRWKSKVQVTRSSPQPTTLTTFFLLPRVHVISEPFPEVPSPGAPSRIVPTPKALSSRPGYAPSSLFPQRKMCASPPSVLRTEFGM